MPRPLALIVAIGVLASVACKKPRSTMNSSGAECAVAGAVECAGHDALICAGGRWQPLACEDRCSVVAGAGECRPRIAVEKACTVPGQVRCTPDNRAAVRCEHYTWRSIAVCGPDETCDVREPRCVPVGPSPFDSPAYCLNEAARVLVRIRECGYQIPVTTPFLCGHFTRLQLADMAGQRTPCSLIAADVERINRLR